MKLLRLLLPLFVATLATLLTVLLSQATVAGGTAASVNGSAITMPWLDAMTKAFSGDGGLQQIAGLQPQPVVQTGEEESRPPLPLPDDELKRRILLAEIRIQIVEGMLGKLASEGVVPARAADVRRQFEERLRAAIEEVRAPGAEVISDEAIDFIVRSRSVWPELVESYLPQEPNEEILRQIYDELPLYGRRVCFQVIRVKDSAAAEKVEEKIRNRESFSAIAEEFSEDLASKPRKGDLGCVTATESDRREIDPALFQAAAANQPGRVQGPIQGAFGGVWYVRTKDEGNTGTDFESAIPQLIQQYREARVELTRIAFGNEARKADIRIVCDVGRWDPQFGVVPCGGVQPSPEIRPAEPGAGDQQPGAGDQQPGAGDQQPGAGDQQPGAGDQQPGAGDQQPGDRPTAEPADEPGR